MDKKFSISEALRFGWRTLKAHSMLVFGVTLTLFALQIFQSMVSSVLKNTAEGMAASIVLSILGFIFGVGALKITLHLARHEHTSFRDIVPAVPLLLRYLGMSAIVGLIFLVPIAIGGALLLGLLHSSGIDSIAAFKSAPTSLFVELGIIGLFFACLFFYFAVRFIMVRYVILDTKEMLGSIRDSWHMTRGHFGHLALFLLALAGINILGALALFVGLLVSIPVSMLAMAHVYTKFAPHRGA